ncbi:MAG: hypothetical protein II459_01080, partial [Erysipelotrichaceae bacterium]|nr:hypothetical protein [Erysipelotrichaceae bacterium]
MMQQMFKTWFKLADPLRYLMIANATSRAQIPSHTKCCQENIMIPFFNYFTITHGKERLNNV